jgi:hypothetical protein
MDRGYRDPCTTVAGDMCRPCNTGWMEEMEDWAKRFLAAPIQGDKRTLRYWRQSLAAAWAVKTALVWESVNPRNQTIPADIFRAFHQLQSASIRQQVWIGQYAGDGPHSFRRTAARVVGAGANVGNEAHAYLVAFTVGQLAYAVYGHLFTVPVAFTLPPNLASSLVPIWPPVQEVVNWPPSQGLDDADLESCVRSLGLPIPMAED